ncbi:SpaA isopeptide-forming pilin-related protein [Candidatus Enterococcus mangumiae]|uniref:Prealbumin-like fold domain-containing protein n=1 Tax=Candidatus Enterococcus mangumiae TaxID=2230878 RepID=A0ABZ2SW58_9ENTE|nr:SpaA isopeptide-forming pilin-related protein [Enterococcus sp. DIV1094]MBO0490247.1 hypothetical protein [Enterococcus sp. DIV1094]
MNSRFSSLKVKPPMLIVVALAIILGIIVKLIIIGGLLRAQEDATLVEVTNSDQTMLTKDNQISDDPAMITIRSSENRLLVLPASEDYAISFSQDGREQPIPLYPADSFVQDEELLRLGIGELPADTVEDATDQTTDETTESTSETTAEAVELATASDVIQVASAEDSSQAMTYLRLVKDQPVTLVFREPTKDMSIVLTDVYSQNYQTLFQWLLPEEPTNETVTTNEPPSEESVVEEEPTEGTAETTQDESTEGTGEPDQEDPSNSSPPPFEADTSYENILVVETEETDLELDELLAGDYQEEDSLVTPRLAADAAEEINATTTNPITISDAKLTVATGTASFDNNDDPGYDSSPDNNIVRSNDQIFYRLGFSIQALPTSNYTNIRYRVISTLPNTSTLVDGAPFINGEISNGTFIDSGQGDGTVISQGAIESTIHESGQVFVPVSINTFAAKNGTVLKPTFELQLIDAFNEETGQIETFNQSYTDEQLPALDAPETIVSSTASIAAQLIRGETTDYQIYDPNATEDDLVYNIGLIIRLNNLSDRIPGDIRGSAYPEGPISFDLKQSVTSTKNGAISPVDPSLYDSSQTRFFSVTNADRSDANWQATSAGNPYVSTFDPSLLRDSLAVPHGKTEMIYYNEPVGDRTKIGVFDSGNLAVSLGNYQETWQIDNYVGIKNPYTYTTAGNTFTNQSFVSAEFIYNWNDTKLKQLMVDNQWEYYTLNLNIPSLTYDGNTVTNNASLNFSSFYIPPGAMTAGPNIVDFNLPDPITNRRTTGMNQDIGFGSWADNIGKPLLMRGQKTYIGGWHIQFNPPENTKSDQIIQWNTNGYRYDDSRQPYNQQTEPDNSTRPYLTYGVRNNGEAMPSLTVPTTIQLAEAYTWYPTVEEAQAAGKIGAVRFQFPLNVETGLSNWNGVPVTVIGDPGSKDANGDPYVVLSSAGLKTADSTLIRSLPGSAGTTFIPAIWNADGSDIAVPYNTTTGVPAYVIGTNAFIQDFGITTSTEVEKSLYQTTEPIAIKVRGSLEGSEEISYDTALNTTLPIGINYLAGSAKDAHDHPLPDPYITENEDGTTTLRWVFPNSSLATGTEVNFLAESDMSKLTFNDLGITPPLVVRTIGEMWVSDEPSLQDTRSELSRSSQDQFVEELIQILSLNKRVDKVAIEEGNHEMAPLTSADAETAFTYTIASTNSATQLAQDFRLLDVLPYNGDSRGSSFNGTLEVASVSVDTTGEYQIYYTTSEIDDTINPNAVDLSGWSQYMPGSSSPNEIQQARAIMLTKDNLAVGETVTLSITVQPDGQLAGDHYENIATMNALVDLPVHSQKTVTHVYGRDLSGIVWEDTNRDGLFNNDEVLLPDIPVKLYRTSSLHPDEITDVLVEHDLKGNVLIDELGNSTVTTDAEGKYIFKHLPEGIYVVEFQIEDKIQRREIAVTTPMVGSDPAINSKAHQTNFKTNEYLAEPLENLPGMTTSEDPVFHIPHLNLGILSTLGDIYLYKFETGTTQDENNDGQPDIDEENQLVGGTKLAGAEFVLQEKETGDAVQTMTTDANGRIYFEDIPFGEYELIETKAPEGYELLKQQIDVTVDADNMVVHLFAEDDLITEFPFAGNNSIMQLLLIIAASLSLVGLIGVGVKYSREGMERKKGGAKKDE